MMDSPGDLLAKALYALEHDDLDPMSRAVFAVVVACRGDTSNGCRWGEAAEIAGVSAVELCQSLTALCERLDAAPESRHGGAA